MRLNKLTNSRAIFLRLEIVYCCSCYLLLPVVIGQRACRIPLAINVAFAFTHDTCRLLLERFCWLQKLGPSRVLALESVTYRLRGCIVRFRSCSAAATLHFSKRKCQLGCCEEGFAGGIAPVQLQLATAVTLQTHISLAAQGVDDRSTEHFCPVYVPAILSRSTLWWS